MDHEIQSGDRVEHNAGEMERFFTYQEIWYSQYVRPAIKDDVKEQFEKCAVPITEQVKKLNTRLLIKSIAYGIILLIIIIFSFSA